MNTDVPSEITSCINTFMNLCKVEFTPVVDVIKLF